jgi:hypothetical protein
MPSFVVGEAARHVNEPLVRWRFLILCISGPGDFSAFSTVARFIAFTAPGSFSVFVSLTSPYSQS